MAKKTVIDYNKALTQNDQHPGAMNYNNVLNTIGAIQGQDQGQGGSALGQAMRDAAARGATVGGSIGAIPAQPGAQSLDSAYQQAQELAAQQAQQRQTQESGGNWPGLAAGPVAVGQSLGQAAEGAVAPYLAYAEHPKMQHLVSGIGKILDLIGHPLAGHFLGTQPGMTAPGSGPVGQSLTGGSPDGQGAQPLYNAGQLH